MKSIMLILAIVITPYFGFAGSGDSDSYSNKKVENSREYKMGNDFQKDLLLFVDLVKSTHPAFAPGYTAPFDIDSVGNDMYLLLKENGNLPRLDNCVSRISAMLNDGHTLSNSMSTAPFVFYPLGIFVDDNDNLFVMAAEDNNAVALGKQIVKVNGYSIDDIISYFRSIVSAENIIGFRKALNMYFQRVYFWETSPFLNVDSRLIVECSDGVKIELTPKDAKDVKVRWHKKSGNPVGVTTPKKELFSYQILEKESICYLQFNQCYDYNAALFQWVSRNKDGENLEEKGKFLEKIKDYPKFDELLAKMFNEIEKNGIKTVVVDVRNNGGGNSRLCNQLLSYLIDYKKLHSTGGDIRISELFRRNYPEGYAQIVNLSKKEGIKIVDGGRYDMGAIYKNEEDDDAGAETIFKMNNDSLKIFNGEVFFMQSKNSYSSAGLLLSLVKQNKIGTIVGEKSSFSPCHYGDILSWKLPNTGITGYVSHKYFTFSDKSMCGDEYLNPDVVIETTLADFYNGDDRAWQWILKAIEEKM